MLPVVRRLETLLRLGVVGFRAFARAGLRSGSRRWDDVDDHKDPHFDGDGQPQAEILWSLLDSQKFPEEAATVGEVSRSKEDPETGRQPQVKSRLSQSQE